MIWSSFEELGESAKKELFRLYLEAPAGAWFCDISGTLSRVSFQDFYEELTVEGETFVLQSENQELVALLYFYDIDEDLRSASLEHHVFIENGQSEAFLAEKVVDWREQNGIRVLYLFVPKNCSDRILAPQLNFTHGGTLREHVSVNGVFVDLDCWFSYEAKIEGDRRIVRNSCGQED